MFFKKLFEIWTGRSLYNQMLEEFISMIDLCTIMFGYMPDFFTGSKKPVDYKEKIFKSDKQINKTERNIRKKIIEHLTVNPGEDLAACLVLMSVTKDAERIGDFCKNLWEVVYHYGKPIKEDFEPACFEMIEHQTSGIRELFNLTREAFMDSNSKLAEDAIAHANSIATRSDGVIISLLESKMPTKQAVAFTLFCRYTKRISAHLANIASAVVLPLHKIDFPKKQSQKGKLDVDDVPSCAIPSNQNDDDDDDDDE